MTRGTPIVVDSTSPSARPDRRLLALAGVAFAVSVLASPLAVIYELVLGGTGILVAGSAVAAGRGGGRARTALAAFAGVAAGGFPYLLVAAWI